MPFHYGHMTTYVKNGRYIAEGCGCDLGPVDKKLEEKHTVKPKPAKNAGKSKRR